MILVVHFIFLCKDDKPWKLLKSLWNPAASSHDVIFDDLIVHISWNLVHVWISRRMISSIINLEKWSLLSHLLGDVSSNIGILSVSLLLVLILINLYFILLLILILFIIVYLCLHLWSLVNTLTFTLNTQEASAVTHVLTLIHVNSSGISVSCSSSSKFFLQSCTLINGHFSNLLGTIMSVGLLILFISPCL
jgi:hypothetical protein